MSRCNASNSFGELASVTPAGPLRSLAGTSASAGVALRSIESTGEPRANFPTGSSTLGIFVRLQIFHRMFVSPLARHAPSPSAGARHNQIQDDLSRDHYLVCWHVHMFALQDSIHGEGKCFDVIHTIDTAENFRDIGDKDAAAEIPAEAIGPAA